MRRLRPPKQLEGPLFLFCAFTLAGSSVIPARYLSVKLGTFTITAVSLTFTLLFLVPIYRKKIISAVHEMSRRDYIFLFLQALIGMFLFRMFLIIGLIHTSAGEAGILTGATPAITAILAAAVLAETLEKKKLIGIFCTIGGVFLIQGLFLSGKSFSMDHLRGNLLILCAAFCESLFNILSRFFVHPSASSKERSDFAPGSQRIHDFHPAVQTSVVSAIAMILCLIPASLEHPAARLAAIGPTEWFALVWYGLFVTALAFIFWYAGIRRCGAITAAAFSGMMPFTSLILATLLLGEHAGVHQWSGGALVFTGIFLISGSQGDKKNAPASRSDLL